MSYSNGARCLRASGQVQRRSMDSETSRSETQLDTLAGQVAVVTGATSGIGRAIAVELGRRGASVIVHGRRQRQATDVVGQIRAAAGDASAVDVTTELCDLADVSTHEPLVERAWKWQGTVDLWINNAGVDVLTGPQADLSFDDKLHRLWQVDVLATLRLSRMVAARMQSAGGSIINIGWDRAEQGMAGDSGEMFATAKGAVMAFTRSLARSAAPNVRVNCVAPGWIKTDWGDNASDYWDRRARGESLLGRWGTAEDVARAVGFLASADAAFVNGQTIAVSGGSQPWPVDWDAKTRGRDS